MSVALDTMVLIWGGLRGVDLDAEEPNLKLAEMQHRSRILLRNLEEAKETIIVPTVSVAELLCGVELRDHGNFLTTLSNRFFCPPLDLQASRLAAELWRAHRELPAESQMRRSTLKVDVLIVATAKVAGAAKFYSHDEKCRKLATRAGMTTRDLPTHSEDLFIQSELEGNRTKKKRSTGGTN